MTKYVINHDGMCEYADVFPSLLDHSMVARSLPGKVISAGFVSFGEGGCSCYGRSVSLDLDSRGEEDSDLVMRQILNHDF